MGDKWIRIVFWMIGLGNLATMALAGPLYDHTYLSSLYPEVFSTIGLIAIGLWGLVYISISNAYSKVPYVVFVVALEKLFYSSLWVPWMLENGADLSCIFQHDLVAGLAYCAWGPYDFISFLFFLYVFIKVRTQAYTTLTR